jgi:hypothetical protein
MQSSRKIQLGPGKQRGKTWLGFEKKKKISQIINDYLYLPFFFLSILCLGQTNEHLRTYRSSC